MDRNGPFLSYSHRRTFFDDPEPYCRLDRAFRTSPKVIVFNLLICK